MLQRLIAALLGLLGLAAAALGIASATAWRADDPLIATATADTATLVTEPGVLEVAGEPVTVTVRATGSPVVLAVGRDTDVAGWVGDDPHQLVTGLADWHDLALQDAATPAPAGSPSAEPSASAPEPSPSASADDGAAQQTAADPTGSDMWVTEVNGDGAATLEWTAPPEGRWSLLAVSLGDTDPTLELSWPQEVTTPWLWPGVATGVLLLAVAAILAVRIRRSRTGADWHDVSTGMIAVVTPQTAGGAAVTAPATTGTIPLIDPATGLPLTRRQIREAEAAAAASRRGRRGTTGAVPTVTGAVPTVPAPSSGAISDAAAPHATTEAGAQRSTSDSPASPHVPTDAGSSASGTTPNAPTDAGSRGSASPTASTDAGSPGSASAAAQDVDGAQPEPRRSLFGRRRARSVEEQAASSGDHPNQGTPSPQPGQPAGTFGTGAPSWNPAAVPAAEPETASDGTPATAGRDAAPTANGPAGARAASSAETTSPVTQAESAGGPTLPPTAAPGSGSPADTSAATGAVRATTSPDPTVAATQGEPSANPAAPAASPAGADSARRGLADRLPWRRQREQPATDPAASPDRNHTAQAPDAPMAADDQVPAVPGVDEDDDSMSSTQRADSWRRMWGFPADADPAGTAQPETDSTDREEDR